MDKLSLATLVWRWIKQRGFNLTRLTKEPLRDGMVLCSGPSKNDNAPCSVCVYVNTSKHGNIIKICQFKEMSNTWQDWHVNAADPECFNKIEHRIKKILR